MVDLLVTRRRVYGAYLDGSPAVLEVEVAEAVAVVVIPPVVIPPVVTPPVVVIYIRTSLSDTDLVLGVAGVSYALESHSLVGVVAPA